MLQLPDAIRQGARLRPQCRGAIYDGRGSSAIGAALEIVRDGYIGPHEHEGRLEELAKFYFPELGEGISRACRVCCRWSSARPDALMGLVVHLEDDHELPREAVADYVEKALRAKGRRLKPEGPARRRRRGVRSPHDDGPDGHERA